MHVITRKRLNEFAERHPGAKSSLARWYAIMRKSRFSNFVELHKIFPEADQVGKFTVFNIGGNKVRLSPRCTIIGTRFTSASVDSSRIQHRQVEEIICRSSNSKTLPRRGHRFREPCACHTQRRITGNWLNCSIASPIKSEKTRRSSARFPDGRAGSSH